MKHLLIVALITLNALVDAAIVCWLYPEFGWTFMQCWHYSALFLGACITIKTVSSLMEIE